MTVAENSGPLIITRVCLRWFMLIVYRALGGFKNHPLTRTCVDYTRYIRTALVYVKILQLFFSFHTNMLTYFYSDDPARC